MGFIFKVQELEKDPTSRVVGDRKVDNVLSTPRNASVHQRHLINDSTCFKRKSVDALAPPYQNVEALAPSYRRVEVFAPDCFNVDVFHPPPCSVNISAPVQDSVEATAPVQDSVDATAPGYYSVDAYCFAPECSYPDSSVEAPAPDSTVPDSSVEAPAPHISSVEANQFNNYAPLYSSVDVPGPRKYAPSTDIVESNVYDNKSNYGEFDWGFVNYEVHFARRQILFMLRS